jgi:phosphoribosylformylglycinamidine cyclo-ligase
MKDFPRMLDVLKETFAFRGDAVGKPLLDFGYYANVLRLTDTLGLAISTDGVGTKILIAEMMGKFDTIGIDCVAMNVNDVICVGAEPIAMTDYVAVQSAEGSFLSQLAIGLREGARQSGMTIPGGEIAQVRELVTGFDLVGTCVGLVDLGKVITGSAVKPGDAIIGFASSGIHSNGLTLARESLLGAAGMKLETHVEDLGRTLGEELLEPTRIYVQLAMRLLEQVDVRALAHITSDGFLNLARIDAPVGFTIDALPQTPPIFDLIQKSGNIPTEDLYLVYNMGVGFCAIVPASDADRTVDIGRALGIDTQRIGFCTSDPERHVEIVPAGLKSSNGHFVKC